MNIKLVLAVIILSVYAFGCHGFIGSLFLLFSNQPYRNFILSKLGKKQPNIITNGGFIDQFIQNISSICKKGLNLVEASTSYDPTKVAKIRGFNL